MKILAIHQNFPGQFRQLVPFLLGRGHQLMGICSHDRPFPPGVDGWRYKAPPKPTIPLELGPFLWNEGLQRCASVAHICKILDERDWVPTVSWPIRVGGNLGIKKFGPTFRRSLARAMDKATSWWIWFRSTSSKTKSPQKLTRVVTR